MKVTVYSTKTCAYCSRLKQWLVGHSIEFNDIYVDDDKQAMKQMIELSGQMSVPFMTVELDDGDVQNILGYDESRLRDIFIAE